MTLSLKQLELLSELLLDLAKGIFLAALAIPAIASPIDFLVFVRLILVGCSLAYLSLVTIKVTEEL